MKKVLKDTLILFIITVVAGFLLALVNEITKEPIEEQKIQAKADACKAVFSDAYSFEIADDIELLSNDSKITFDELYKALDENGKLLGFVLNLSTKEGYGGNISFAMGVTKENHLNAISILSSSETVGLGLEAETVLVPQFKDKDVARFTYTKTGSKEDSEIDAISSATITTNAFVNAVNAGLDFISILNEKEAE